MEKLLILSNDAATIEAFSACAAELSLIALLKEAPSLFDFSFSGGGMAGFIIDKSIFPGDAVLWAECERLRSGAPSAFLIFLAEKLSRNDEIKAYALGADHCFEKPVHELIVKERLSALLHRYSKLKKADAAGSKLRRVSGLEIYVDRYEARAFKKRIPLTKAEFLLLETLSRTPGKVVSHEILGRVLWGWDSDNYLTHIKCHISRLRSKLQSAHAGAGIISFRGSGYALTESDGSHAD